jgi:hypothetical protein
VERGMVGAAPMQVGPWKSGGGEDAVRTENGKIGTAACRACLSHLLFFEALIPPADAT